MKIIHSELKKGIVKVKTENLDDLWYLSNIIDKNDFVRGETTRKIKIGEESDRKPKIIKKKVRLKIKIEKVDLEANVLKVGGGIVEGPEDIPRGSHHTFNIEENSIITIEKERFLKYQYEKLKEATETKVPKTLILLRKTYGDIFSPARFIICLIVMLFLPVLLMLPIFPDFTPYGSISDEQTAYTIIASKLVFPYFFWTLGMALVVIVGTAGASQISEEVSSGTMLILVSKPISRFKIFLGNITAKLTAIEPSPLPSSSHWRRENG